MNIAIIILFSGSVIDASKCAGEFEMQQQWGYANLECSNVHTQTLSYPPIPAGTGTITVNQVQYDNCTALQVSLPTDQKDPSILLLYECPGSPTK